MRLLSNWLPSNFTHLLVLKSHLHYGIDDILRKSRDISSYWHHPSEENSSEELCQIWTGLVKPSKADLKSTFFFSGTCSASPHGGLVNTIKCMHEVLKCKDLLSHQLTKGKNFISATLLCSKTIFFLPAGSLFVFLEPWLNNLWKHDFDERKQAKAVEFLRLSIFIFLVDDNNDGLFPS